MTEESSGPQDGIEGMTEAAKGKAKEMTGAATGQESLESEGLAQQDKAASLREVSRREAEADEAKPQARPGTLVGEGKATQPEKLIQKEDEADNARAQASVAEAREHAEHAKRKQ